MRWADWKFSAQLAVQDRSMRWMSLLTAVIIVSASGFFLWRLLPEGWRSGVIIMHYNVYLGIDDVRPWPWLFFIPGIASLAFAVDLVCAYGLFRRHALASRTMMTVGLAATSLWAVGSFFIMLVNV